MQRCPLGKREDHSRRSNEEPEEQRRPARGDKRREERQGDDGRAHILPTGLAKPADQVGEDLLERNATVRFGPAGKSGVDPTGEIRPGVRLEADQKRGRVETKPDQKAATTDADQTDQTMARGPAGRRSHQRAPGDPAADDEQGVIGALAEPRGQDLADGETGQSQTCKAAGRRVCGAGPARCR